jgi:hypothetical protein
MALRQSSVRVLAWTAVAVAAAIATGPSAVRADPAGDFQPYVGEVTADDVYVRSGPTEGFYATSKLNKGDRVTVVGIRGLDNDYLKVVPPDGSFCYVAKAFVELQPGSTTAGKVTRSDLIVRAGSTLNGKMNTMLMKLDAGDAVQLVGPQDDGKYFKIAPPPGAYLYVKKSLVSAVPNTPPVAVPLAAQANDREPIASDPAPAAPKPAAPTPPPAPVAVAPQPPVPPQPVAIAPAQPLVPATPAVAPEPTPPAVALATPTTKPADVGDAAALASAKLGTPATTRPSAVAIIHPTTRPVLSAQEQFDRAETEFARISSLPLEKQPLEGLKWRYKTLANSTALPAALRQVAEGRESALALRIDARGQLVEANRSATEAASRERALTAEQQELSQRVKDQEVATYAAVGTLRISSLQQSGPTLYRLTDPNTGRTLIYLRSNDPKYADLMNQFIGVHGAITQDEALSLRYVTPTDAEAVDAAKVNYGISAVVSPPSLLPKSSTASVGG